MSLLRPCCLDMTKPSFCHCAIMTETDALGRPARRPRSETENAECGLSSNFTSRLAFDLESISLVKISIIPLFVKTGHMFIYNEPFKKPLSVLSTNLPIYRKMCFLKGPLFRDKAACVNCQCLKQLPCFFFAMQLEQARNLILEAIGRKDLLMVVGDCNVEYWGRAASKLPRGKRLLMIKIGRAH